MRPYNALLVSKLVSSAARRCSNDVTGIEYGADGHEQHSQMGALDETPPHFELARHRTPLQDVLSFGKSSVRHSMFRVADENVSKTPSFTKVNSSLVPE